MQIKNYISIFFLLVCFIVPSTSNAQWRLKRQAKKAFKSEQYNKARKLLYQYDKTELYPQLLYYRAISNYNCNDINLALNDLVESYKLGNNDRNVFLYLAKILHSQGKYILAINKYKAYLRSNPKENDREAAIQNIKECATSLRFRMNGKNGYVSKFKNDINSITDETNPMYSFNSKHVFYYNAIKDNKIKSIFKGHHLYHPINLMTADSIWSNELETFGHSGKSMIYKKSYNKKLSLVIQGYNKDGEMNPYYYNCPADITKGDKDLFIFQDSILLFSSERSEGYGGYDIYITIKTNKKWSQPQNLGPSINTTANEITPYLCNNGLKLYLSSDRINGIGAFDIYRSEYIVENQSWSKPSNLNSPINSPNNDLSFKLSKDGIYALLSSDRKSSKGGYDIFRVKLSVLEIAQHQKNKKEFYHYE